MPESMHDAYCQRAKQPRASSRILRSIVMLSLESYSQELKLGWSPDWVFVLERKGLKGEGGEQQVKANKDTWKACMCFSRVVMDADSSITDRLFTNICFRWQSN